MMWKFARAKKIENPSEVEHRRRKKSANKEMKAAKMKNRV